MHWSGWAEADGQAYADGCHGSGFPSRAAALRWLRGRLPSHRCEGEDSAQAVPFGIGPSGRADEAEEPFLLLARGLGIQIASGQEARRIGCLRM